MISRRETTWIRRRKERGTGKATRLSPLLGKKRTREIAEDATRVTMLNLDATMCQYLMAERFVKSILEYQHKMQEGVREISDVIMKRLISLDEYADVKNGDRATQQLRLLADVIAHWIIEIYDEVAETHKEIFKQYDKKRRMKRLEVNDNKTNNKSENWGQMGQIKEKEKQERKSYETSKRNNLKKENEKEQKGDESDKEKDKAKEKEREKKQLDNREAKSDSVKEEMIEIEEEENVEKGKEEQEEKSKEVHETEEKESGQKEVTTEE